VWGGFNFLRIEDLPHEPLPVASGNAVEEFNAFGVGVFGLSKLISFFVLSIFWQQ